MRESAIERRIVAEAAKLGIRTYKVAGAGERGKPDRLWFRQGKIAFTELKRPGKAASALQEKKLAELRAEGFPAECFDGVGAALKWVVEQLL